MSLPTKNILRLGTRGSLLARMQSQQVADLLMRKVPSVQVQLRIIRTTGDTEQQRPLYEIGGKGLFVKELEQSLLNRGIDFAVHSFKDVPVTKPLLDVSSLLIAAVVARQDVRDVLVGAASIAQIPRGARVGTSSPRRRCQILSHRPDLDVQPIRGNIDTRLRKQREGQFDAILLAMAGLKRTGLFDESRMFPIPPDQMMPAAGQGALALQCRRDDLATLQLLQQLNDSETAACVDLERQVVLALNGDCHSPIAALATLKRNEFNLSVAVGSRDGNPPLIRAHSKGEDPPAVLATAMQQLKKQNAPGT